MSIAEFSSALKNRAISEWFKVEKAGGGSASAATRKEYSAENINNLVNATSGYRAAEQTAAKTSFIITKDTVRQLIVDLQGISDSDPRLDDLTNIAFTAFKSKNTGVAVSRRKITVADNMPAVYFPNISFKSITDLVNNILNLKTNQLASKYEKGHVVGLNTQLLQQTAARISNIDTRGSTGKSTLLQHLTSVIDYYKRLDLASANIQPAGDVKIYASVNKSISKAGATQYLVELQPKQANQSSAREVQATIGSIRKLFTPAGLSDKALLDIIDNISKSVTDPKFQSDLLDMKSSPSFKDMLANNIAAALTGKPVDQNYSHKNVLVATKNVPPINLKEINVAAKAKVKELTDLVNKTKQVAKIRTPTGQFYSVTALQTLINELIPKQMEKNMGKGDSRVLLNYRTGRLAESPKVERMSVSREGMITAFYTYMRNPYGTFSQGGQQSEPPSRDPKLLIAKSIREIAATKVANRMRSVLV